MAIQTDAQRETDDARLQGFAQAAATAAIQPIQSQLDNVLELLRVQAMSQSTSSHSVSGQRVTPAPAAVVALPPSAVLASSVGIPALPAAEGMDFRPVPQPGGGTQVHRPRGGADRLVERKEPGVRK